MGISVLAADDNRTNRMVMERLPVDRVCSVATAYEDCER